MRYNEGMDEQGNGRIPARLRAIGFWARCWQLAGGEWPPPSRAIAHQIVMALSHLLRDASQAALSRKEAFVMARSVMAPLLAQRFFPGSEQDIAIERLTAAILDVEGGDLPGADDVCNGGAGVA